MKTTQDTTEKETILSAKHEIATAAKDAIGTIATAAAEAAKVVATATASAAKLVETKTAGDHDKIVEMLVKMEDLKCSVNVMNENLSSQFVTQIEFKPIKAIVFGMVGTILIAVIGALLGLVIFKV